MPLFRRTEAGSYVATPSATDYGAPPEPVEAPAVEPEIAPPVIPTHVRHTTFGEGTVLSAIGEGEGLKYVVIFGDAGQKTLLARLLQAID